MWIFTNKGILSVVQDRNHKETLLVRARQKGFLESIVENPEEVFHDPAADYPYRIFMSRTDFAGLLVTQMERINYPNFKNSVEDNVLHSLYSKVWSVMSVLGMGRLYGRRAIETADDYPSEAFEEDGSLSEDWRPTVRRRKRN